jgi:hypothetical protein
VAFAAIQRRADHSGGETIKDARLVSEDELEMIAKRLPFFIASGADDNFNYYQLREFGYFNCDRKFAKNNQPKNKDLVFGLVPVGATNLFVTFVNGRITIPNPDVLTPSNIEAFSPYLAEPDLFATGQ